MMIKLSRIIGVILISIAILFWWSGCTTEEIIRAAQIKGTLRLKPARVMEGKFIIEEAYLKLSHIDAIGRESGKTITNLTHPIPGEEPPYQLSKLDSNQVIFNLPSRRYDGLDFHLFLFQDTYQLIIREESAGTNDPKEGGNNSDDGDGDEDEDDDDDDDDDDDEDEDEDDEDDGRMPGSKKKRIVDLDHFFQNAKPSMVISGIYRNNAKTIRVLFVVNGIDKLILTGKQNGSPLLNLNKRNLADITFDPEFWFNELKTSHLESASLQNYRGEQVLFIHRDFNTPLFKALSAKLQGSAELNFNPLADGGL